MTLGSAALPFIIKHRDAIAPKVPVVFTAVAPQNYAALQPPPEVTGIITEFNLDKTLALAERLQPDARRLFVIAGSGATDRRWQTVARAVIENRDRKFETTYLYELSYDKLVAELSQVPRDAIVILLTVFADSGAVDFLTKPVSDQDLLGAIARAQEQDAKSRQIRTELASIQSRIMTLTPREREVLTHVVAGRLNKQIAGDLGTVEKTIKVHRSRMMEKLGVRTVADLVRMAEKAGISR
jgi:DNA-binding CsgD family transcriptional regulator/CheY-like chemotaxis protein